MKRLIFLAMTLCPLNDAVAADLYRVMAYRHSPTLGRPGQLWESGSSQAGVFNHGMNGRTELMADSNIPFLGTRVFNLRGGTRTVESVTIDGSGNATLKDVDSGVYWRGKFINPIPLSGRGMLGGQAVRGLLFEKSRVYPIGDNGQVIMGCRNANGGSLCETQLDPLLN